MSTENIKDTQSNSRLIKGIKEENIIVMKGINYIFYICLLIFIISNASLIYYNVKIIYLILCDISFISLLCFLLFIPVGIHFTFDYINKGIIVYKFTIIHCLGKCFYKNKNIAFKEIRNFDIETYWYFNKKNYNLGYYDKNSQFQTLITGQDPTMKEEFSPEIFEISKKLNDLLEEQNI
jgi:hypothetical protein